MAYSATKNTSGLYEVSQDGQRISTGSADVLGRYGLSESQLSSTPLAGNVSQASVGPAMQESTAGQNANANYFQNGLQPAPQNMAIGQVNNGQNIQNGLNTAQTQLQDVSAQIAQKYKTGVQTAQQSGMPAPKTSGQASQAVTGITGGPTQMPSVNPVDTLMSQDKDYQNLLKTFNDFTSAEKQKESATQEYLRLEKEAGLEKINTDLINMRNVIDGTEDDIRNEISAVGGFGTESQVQALAGARNKGLIKNYNNLLETQKNVQNRINTLTGLSAQDRQYAQQSFENQFNFQKQMIEYRDKFVNNAKEGYNAIIQAQGYAGLLNALGGDQYSINLAERTLGLQPGGLQQLASYNKPLTEEEKLGIELKKSQLKTDVLQRTNIQSQIDERNAPEPTVNGVPEKTMGKIQSSSEYKTINGVLPAIQSLKSYKDAIDTYGTYERYSGQGKGTLEGTYGNAIASWKSLAGLGALSGADFELAENAVPATGLFKRDSTAKAKLTASLDNAVKQAETLTKRLIQNYPEAKANLEKQLDDVYVTAYPDRYMVGPDGNVYEID